MEKTPQNTSRKRKPSNLIDTYIAQCGKCDKWRSIETQEEYEEIRSEALNKPFECKNSCEEPGDVDVECDSMRVCFLDHQHGLPKTPQGLKRILVLREKCDKVDVYYLTPQGKRLRSCREVSGFIQNNKNFIGTNIEDISFAKPKLMKKNTKFEDVALAKAKDKKENGKRRSLKKKKIQKVPSLEIPLPLEHVESIEKTSEAKTHTHNTLNKREDRPLSDVELSPAQKGCDKLSKKNQNKESVIMKSNDDEENHMPGSLQHEKQATDKKIKPSTLSKKKKKRDRKDKPSKKKKQAIDDNERNIKKQVGTKKISSDEVRIKDMKKGKLDGKDSSREKGTQKRD